MNLEIEENIRKNVSWPQLPAHVKQMLGNSSKSYDKIVISFSIKNQLRYRGNLVKHILRDEKRYYERVVAFSRERLMLFPYHLADMIVKGLRITPFNYYISVVEKLMQAEKSYDTLPNFTAADCLRLLGIGRNEYIELMNRSRSNRGRLFGKRNVRGLLPRVPCDIYIEPWWRVEVGMVLEEDIKMVNEEELELIDKLIDHGSQTAGELNYHVVLNLYKKGLIYLDVPITAVDRVQVPPLQGFVMNRVLGDYFETLLYKIFVSIDEHTTVGELAAVLEVETELVKQAVSLYCRLRFARKLDAEPEFARIKRHLTWNQQPVNSVRSVDITPLTLNLNSENNLDLTNELQSPQSDVPDSPATNTLSKQGQRIAFLFDSALTAFLMMGNLSPGLKKHAVTMFEVGKLCDESLDSFLAELEKVSVLDAEGEGEARRFFDHAVILRSTVLSLRKLPSPGLDLIRLESLHSLDEATCSRLLQKKYKLLVSMAPLSREVRPVVSLAPPHLGPAVPEVNSLWFKMFLYHMTGYGPPSLLLRKGTELKQLPRMFLGYSRLLVTAWLHEPAVIPVGNILHVNAALQYSSVLIQAYGVHQPAQTFILPFPIRPNLSTKQENLENFNWNNHPAIKNLSELVDLEHNCGYITLIDIGVPDFGCPNRDPIVRLGKSNNTSKNANTNPGVAKQIPIPIPIPNSLNNINNNNISEEIVNKCELGPTSISNENFTFVNMPSTNKQPTKAFTSFSKKEENVEDKASSLIQQQNDDDNNKMLQSPVESHFALTPVTNSESSSPANGFTGVVCTELLNEELDQLEKEALKVEKLTLENCKKEQQLESPEFAIDTLLSPTDETINMFTKLSNENLDDKEVIKESPIEEYKGEVWSLLDCHFGIPLFDVDANTKICDTVVSGGLTNPESLEKLVESSRKLGTAVLEFISQCQYYPGEKMGIVKRGRLTPLPNYNLVFDNGKVSEWTGK